jgi:hypothetical protein
MIDYPGTMSPAASDKLLYVNYGSPSDGASKLAKLESYSEIKLPEPKFAQSSPISFYQLGHGGDTVQEN